MEVRYQFDQVNDINRVFGQMYSLPHHILKADESSLALKYLSLQQQNGAWIDTPYLY